MSSYGLLIRKFLHFETYPKFLDKSKATRSQALLHFRGKLRVKVNILFPLLSSEFCFRFDQFVHNMYFFLFFLVVNKAFLILWALCRLLRIL